MFLDDQINSPLYLSLVTLVH